MTKAFVELSKNEKKLNDLNECQALDFNEKKNPSLMCVLQLTVCKCMSSSTTV